MSHAAAATVRPSGGLNLQYLRIEIQRLFSNRQTVLLTVLLPAVLYLALHRIGSGSDGQLPHGNFAMWMMLGQAVYGAALSATSSSATIALERGAGWMRTLRLTPIRPWAYVLTKAITSMCLAALPVIVVGAIGTMTGAQAPAHVWVLGLATAWLGSLIFAALGLALGLALKPEAVMHLPGITLTVLGFLGNLFIPLSGTMLTIASYTPMFGVTTLARYALTDGTTFSGEHLSLNGALINTACWFAVFVFIAARRFARGTGRQ